MRTICWTTLAGLVVVLAPAVACASQEPAAKAVAAQDAPALKDGKEKTSYAVGMNLGGVIRKDADLDVNLIVQGLRDAFSGGKLLLTEAEMRQILNQLATDLKTKQMVALREKGSKARSEGEAFPAGNKAAEGVVSINISVKRDPRISKGLYLGDRWLPLPYTQVGEGKQVTVEARAEGIAHQGKPVRISPRWIAADPAMITVTPAEGNDVMITVLRPGESSIEVSSHGVSRQLGVKADYAGETLQVRVSQK